MGQGKTRPHTPSHALTRPHMPFYDVSYCFRMAYPNLEHTLLIKVINVGSDTFGNPIFQKGLQN